MKRQEALTMAGDALDKRGEQYGAPERGLQTAARLWSVILAREVQAYEVALCLDALKTSRILANPTHEDSWIDKAGYTAIAAELATEPPSDTERP